MDPSLFAPSQELLPQVKRAIVERVMVRDLAVRYATRGTDRMFWLRAGWLAQQAIDALEYDLADAAMQAGVLPCDARVEGIELDEATWTLLIEAA